LTDQEALHNSTVAVKNMPRPGALLNLDPRSMFLGWTELPREAHEDGYWCISFVNRETHRIKAGRSARTWQGASNTSINRLLRSLRPSDQKPRHPVTCSTCAGEYAGSSRVDTARAGLSTKTWSAGMLTCSRSCGIQKRIVLFFWEARGFRFLGILRRQPKVYSSTSLSTPGASHASSPPQKVGFEGHYCMAGLRARSLAII
jgi:hypothetical protein